MNSDKYAKIFILSFVGLIVLIVILNRIVDPFWYYSDIDIVGFNHVKTQFHKYESEIKPFILKKTKPNALIISNSFFEIGLEPNHAGFSQNQNLKTYNFGMVAAKWDRVYCNTLFALDNTDVKSLIIGIDLESMPIVDCNKKFMTMGQVDQLKLLLSLDALRSSINTLKSQRKHATHTKDGLFFYHRNKANEIEQVFHFYMSKHKNHVYQNQCSQPKFPEQISDLSDAQKLDYEGFKKLLERLKEKHISTKIIVYPYHALWMELIQRCSDAANRWNKLYYLSGLVAAFNDRNIQLWDFQNYSKYFSEKIANNQTQYWQDYGHFNYELGNIIMDVLFMHKNAMVDGDYDIIGYQAIAESVKQRYIEFQKIRRRFIESNAWFMADYDRLIN